MERPGNYVLSVTHGAPYHMALNFRATISTIPVASDMNVTYTVLESI